MASRPGDALEEGGTWSIMLQEKLAIAVHFPFALTIKNDPSLCALEWVVRGHATYV